jgi:RHH-type proline utilization regulon transcriptional repressor/proline dehydrogenase/delta 1-pyrroline-5-carboxylate dehydrogenase
MIAARAQMRALHRAPEPEVLATLLPAALLGEEQRLSVVARARPLISGLKAAATSGWVNRFLQHYQLGSDEGTALLSLAEAFLRVPDPATADLLIRDKLGQADWKAKLGDSNSLIVNSATWGLVMGKAMLADPQAGVLRRLLSRTGEPFIRQAVAAAMRLMGEVFVMGRSIDEALGFANKQKGFTASFDMLGEAAHTFPDAEGYFGSYLGAIEAIGHKRSNDRISDRHSISVKLSALHPRYETAHASACVPTLTELGVTLAQAAAAAGIGLTIDAEESERLDMSLDIIGAVAAHPALNGWDGLGMAVQAYGKRAPAVIDWAEALGAKTRRRVAVRLVKGAYWDSEIKRTQALGLADYPLFTRKPATDVSWLACARAMLAAPHIYPAFATHNALTVATVLEWAGNSRDFEFQRLHGMGDGLFEDLVRNQGHHCRIYAPVGGHRDLLAYLVRRLLENGANTSFVHQIADDDTPEEELLADPAARVARSGGQPHPAIRRPHALYAHEAATGGRVNSPGIDLADAPTLEALAATAATTPLPPLPAAVDIAAAVARAQSASAGWAATPVEERAARLESLADAIETDSTNLIGLLVREARKSLPDAVAEVREAIDFCRYYAAQARILMQPQQLPGPTGETNCLYLAPRGPFATIAPWNFPLAIFVGQCAAGLVTGNPVLAKPAPQTPRIAARAVALAHAAGIPADVLQLVPGGGAEGDALVRNPGVQGVAFTGSTGTARVIARALLDDDRRPLIPFIAETGGINAMIVDSTALPEQVVSDVIASAFQSAGQRCSALRLLVVQREVAETIITMLKGAMNALVVGPANDPMTDVPPVIDADAHAKLEAYRQSVRPHWLHTIAAPAGEYIAPTLIGIEHIADLQEEWFGPLLHVTTWAPGQLAETVQAVNALGYGLTLGLHSRIAGAADDVQSLAQVGNLYVNRSIIGAVVGTQPFGGEARSGTGFKAGGPHYLLRFCTERTVTVDTTSAGGNASLLSLEEEL